MIVETTSLFQDHPAVGLIMSSPNPSLRKRIGRSVRNFDPSVGDRETQNPVLSSTYAKFTQNPGIKNNLLSSDNNVLAEFSPLDPVWDTGLRADDPRVNNPCQWRAKLRTVRHVLPITKLFAAVRPGRRTRPSLVGSAPALRLQKPSNLVRAVVRLFTVASIRNASSSEFPTYVLAALPNSTQ